MLRVPASLVTPLVALGALLLPGDLTPPPGPIAPTMKTLDEVEARRPVSSLPSSGSAMHVIAESGSYYLTGDLVMNDDKHGIEVQADYATIDLNGFSIVGELAQSRHGVVAHGFGLTLRNGTIRNLVGVGVNLASTGGNHTLEDLRITGVLTGVATAPGTVMRRCFVRNATSSSFMIVDTVVAEACYSYGAGYQGFWIDGFGAVLRDCIARGGAAHGFYLTTNSERCSLTGCLAVDNDSQGFFLSNGSGHFAGANQALSNLGGGFSVAMGDPGMGPVVTDLADAAASNPWANFVR